MDSSKIPSSLVKLSKKLFGNTDEQERFLSCFINRPERELALVAMNGGKFENVLSPLDYFPPWVHRVQGFSSEPHDRGDFYVLDSSSVFAASPLLQLERPNII